MGNYLFQLNEILVNAPIFYQEKNIIKWFHTKSELKELTILHKATEKDYNLVKNMQVRQT